MAPGGMRGHIEVKSMGKIFENLLFKKPLTPKSSNLLTR
jgi:hypothetical protein